LESEGVAKVHDEKGMVDDRRANGKTNFTYKW
jgi:hypothetical protein